MLSITPAVHRKRQQGLATVEMAIMLPLLLLLMLASAELGRAFYSYNTLNKTVRDGARYGSTIALNGAGAWDIDPATNTKEAEIKNMVVYGYKTSVDSSGAPRAALVDNLTVNDVLVTEVDLPGPGGSILRHVQVTATVPYTPLFAAGIPRFGLGGGSIAVSFNMSSSVTMRGL